MSATLFQEPPQEIVLRDYQDAATDNVNRLLGEGHAGVMLYAPCGAGKTVIAMWLLKQWSDIGRRCVFLCDRIALVDQTSAMFEAHGLAHGVIQADHWRKNTELVQIATPQTIARRDGFLHWHDEEGKPLGPHLVIYDEAHLIYDKAVEYLEKKECYTIGLSATPFTKNLAKIYSSITNVATTNELIAQGSLSSWHAYAAKEPDMEGAKVVAGEWTDEAVSERAIPIIGDVVKEYLQRGQEKKFIAFGCNVGHCEELQRAFMAAGVVTALYTYRTAGEERTAAINGLKTAEGSPGCVRGLISVNALSTGFDAAEVGVVILCRPFKASFANLIQCIGRGLRPHASKEDGGCIFLDHAGNMARHWGKIIDLFENGWDELDDGKKPDKNKPKPKEKKPVKCPVCALLLAKPMPFCPSCGFEFPKATVIVHREGEMERLDGGSVGLSKADKLRLYAELLWIAESRGYQPGWIAHKYKERTGVWPKGCDEVAPVEPSLELVNEIRNNARKWAKEQKTHAIS